MGILLVYDVTDERSFNNIRNWIKNIEQHASEGVNKILIGNKCDVLEKKVLIAALNDRSLTRTGDKLLLPNMELDFWKLVQRTTLMLKKPSLAWQSIYFLIFKGY